MFNRKNILGYFIILLFSAYYVSAERQDEGENIYVAYYFENENEASNFLKKNKKKKISKAFQRNHDNSIIFCIITKKEYGETENNDNNNVDSVTERISNILHTKKGLHKSVKIELLQDSKENEEKQIYQKRYRDEKKIYEHGVFGNKRGQLVFCPNWENDNTMPIKLIIPDDEQESTGWEKAGKAFLGFVVVGGAFVLVYKIFVEPRLSKQGNKKKGKKRRKNN